MSEARYAMRPGTVGYGTICPECASPKHRQSKRCKDCYYAARRRGEFPPPPVPQRKPKPVNKVKGGSKGRPQPQSHPWRKDNALLFMKRRVVEMADEGVRPATPGGRIRSHFAALTEDAA